MTKVLGEVVLHAMWSPLNLGVIVDKSDKRVFWVYTGCCIAHVNWDQNEEEWSCSDCRLIIPKISGEQSPGIRIVPGQSSDFRKWVWHWTALNSDVIDIRVEWPAA